MRKTSDTQAINWRKFSCKFLRLFVDVILLRYARQHKNLETCSKIAQVFLAHVSPALVLCLVYCSIILAHIHAGY